MTIDEMSSYLNQIQNSSPQTKILSAILTCFQEVKQLEGLVIELQKKVNQIIGNWNTEIEGVKNAEALNSDIEEDTHEEDIIDELTVPADSQSIEEVK